MELELKYKIQSFPKQKILDLGFQKKSESHQIDNYYIVNQVLDEKRTYLRTREDKNKNTFSFDFHQIISILATDETEMKICTKEDSTKLHRILEALGYPIVCVIDKQREVYEKDDIKVVLDTVKNLGNFIEIEIEGIESQENQSKLNNTAILLGLNENDRVSKKGYPDLFLETINTPTQ